MKSTTTSGRKSRVAMLAGFLHGSTHIFLLSVLFAALKALFDLLLPQVIRFTVDNVLGGLPADLPPFLARALSAVGGIGFFRAHLWMLAVLALAVGLAAVAANYFDMYFCSVAAEKLVKRMRDCLFRHIQQLPFSFHQKNKTGDVIQRCTSDVETVKRFLSDQMTSLLRILLLLFLSLWFMFSMNARLAWIALGLLPVILLYSAYFGERVRRTFSDCDENEGILSQIAQENLTGVRVVRAFGREKSERDRFEKQNKHYTHLWMKTMTNLSAFWAMGDLISGMQTLLILVLGCKMCIGENPTMTAGECIAFFSYNAMLIWPIRQLGRMISEMSKAGVSIDRIAAIMAQPVEEDVPVPASCDYRGDIVFDHVSFGYDGCPELLHDLSFTLHGGETLGILGGTGSGKSTLAALLDRLYTVGPESGSITIGGTDIRMLPAKELRENVGIVLQEPFLFSRTIAENISITQKTAEDAEIRAAAESACLSEAVDRFASGYATEVGERGVTLSGGQKQRLAIARLLMQKTPIMIFDDSLSAVDTETDEKIRRTLRTELSDSTVILIAHRISTLMDADKILVLESGRIAQFGTPAELLQEDGLFRAVYELQNGMEQEAQQ